MESCKTLKFLIFILTIFSLSNIGYKNGYFVKPWPYLKILIMLFIVGSLSTYNLYLHYTYFFFTKASPSVVITDTVRAALGYFEYIVDLYFVYNYSSEAMCEYYDIYDQMDKNITMKYNKRIEHKVVALIAFFLPCWLLASLGEYAVWGHLVSWKSSTTYIPTYFMFLVRLLTAMDLNSQTMHVEYRLRTASEKILDFAFYLDDSSMSLKTVWNSWYIENQNKLKEPSLMSKCRNEVMKLNSYYLLLIVQTAFLNKFFGVRILLHCLYTMIEMVTFVNIIARLITRSTMLFTSYLPITTSILRFFNCIAVLTSVVYHCESCHQQCNVVVDAIDRVLVNKKLDDEVQASLICLRRLVFTRPLRFHAAGFFNLDSVLLLSVVSVVITYAVVILQTVP